jgi:hypothetical protein
MEDDEEGGMRHERRIPKYFGEDAEAAEDDAADTKVIALDDVVDCRRMVL